MKSKISFFNKTIFLKNVTLYWPIWVVYTLFLVGGMPFALWLSVHDRFNMEPITIERMIREIYYVTRPTYYICVIAAAAVIVGMALFSYLYKSQSANMIHALPIDRTELFGTNVISGLVFLIVPQIFTFVVTVFICLSEGITRVEYLAMWLLFAVATAFIAFAFVTICAFLTGQLVTMPVYVIVVNVLAYVIDRAISFVVSLFGYGISGSGLMSSDLLIWFSPFLNYLRNVNVSLDRDKFDKITGMQLAGIECIVVYFIVAVGLYVLAYFIYRTRKIEQAGDLITVEILKPVFRWGVGTICGFYATLFFVSIFGNSGYGFNKIVFVIELLFFGTLFYFVADMFVRKTFHVFKKKNWKGCGLFCIALILTFGGMICYANIEEKRVPKIEDVDYAIINMNYSITLEDEEIAEAINIHKAVLEDVDFFEEYDNYNYYYYDEEVYYTSIRYKLKDGSYLERYYSIPNTGKGVEIINRINAMEQLPENMLSHWFGAGYDRVTTFEYGYLNVEAYKPEYDPTTGMVSYVDASTELTYSQCKKLFEAIIADAREGSLGKYNGYDLSGKEEAIDEDKVVEEQQIYSIDLEYRLPASGVARGSYMDYSYYQYINVRFGKDCKNIVAAITDLGIPYIDSEDDIFWGK